MPEILNAKGHKIAHSFSKIVAFENCPFSYAGSHFYCTVPYHESEEAIFGNRVHKTAEMFIKGKGPLDYEVFPLVEDAATKMIRTGCRIFAEMELAFNVDLEQVSWFDPSAWFRMKIDIVLEKSDTICNLYDWKTSKNIKHSDEQLRINAAGHNIVFPNFEEYNGYYIWVKHKKATPIKPIKKHELIFIWEDILARTFKIEEAWRLDRFPATPSGLCPWCRVQNCKNRRGEMRP